MQNIQQESNRIIVPEKIFGNPSIKPAAIAIFTYIAAAGADGATKKGILKSLSMSEETYLKHIKALMEQGFVLRTAAQDQSGRFVEARYISTEFEEDTIQGKSVHGKTGYGELKTSMPEETVCGENVENLRFLHSYKKDNEDNIYNNINIKSSSSSRESIEDEESRIRKISRVMHETLTELGEEECTQDYEKIRKASIAAICEIVREDVAFMIEKEKAKFIMRSFIQAKIVIKSSLTRYLVKYIKDKMDSYDYIIEAEREKKRIKEEREEAIRRQQEIEGREVIMTSGPEAEGDPKVIELEKEATRITREITMAKLRNNEETVEKLRIELEKVDLMIEKEKRGEKVSFPA